jgi:hypothetical protein
MRMTRARRILIHISIISTSIEICRLDDGVGPRDKLEACPEPREAGKDNLEACPTLMWMRPASELNRTERLLGVPNGFAARGKHRLPLPAIIGT